MPLFKCIRCGCVENTALGEYWSQQQAPLCSQCSTGEWHGRFPKETAAGPKWKRGSDGFLYEDGGWKPASVKIVGDA